MFTTEEVELFLSTTLGMVNWREKLKEDKLSFLKSFVLACELKTFYQNVTWSAIPYGKRKCPDMAEVIKTGLTNSGGMCIHLNVFAKLILEQLGFDVFNVSIASPRWELDGSHVGVIVRLSSDSSDNEIYFVDVGFACRPFLEPIPLHNLPHRAEAGGFIVEHRFNEETRKYERILHGGCPCHGKLKDIEGGKRLDFAFDLIPREFEHFNYSMTEIFTDHDKNPILHNILLFRAEGPLDYEYVSFHGKSMVLGSKSKYEETDFETYEEMKPAIFKYFPQLDKKEVEAAILTYNQIAEEKWKKLEFPQI